MTDRFCPRNRTGLIPQRLCDSAAPPAEDFSDLCERLALLEGRHKSAPLITVRGGEAAASASQDSSAWLEEQCASPCAEGDGDAEAWELL